MAQINKPTDYFNTVTYTGNGTAIGSGGNAITGVGFQPDFLWIKNRSSALHHGVFDVVRGTPKRLLTSATAVEDSNTETVDSFDADGFTVGSNANVNGSGNSLVAWNWLAGGTASSNTDGSITSNVSASTTSGFSIVSYTGTGSNATVGHNLGAVPKMIIVKNRDRSAAGAWQVYHASIGATQTLELNDTTGAYSSSTRWNNTSPTSSVFSIGSSLEVNGSGESVIAYCFAEKKGFSKFGSYTGNGSTDGTFVYTGFKPAFVIYKKSSSANDWIMKDSVREPNNQMAFRLKPNSSNAEDSLSGGQMDFLSNGFKFRVNDDVSNASGGTYIYMAFAAEPLTGTNGVPCTAR